MLHLLPGVGVLVTLRGEIELAEYPVHAETAVSEQIRHVIAEIRVQNEEATDNRECQSRRPPGCLKHEQNNQYTEKNLVVLSDFCR